MIYPQKGSDGGPHLHEAHWGGARGQWGKHTNRRDTRPHCAEQAQLCAGPSSSDSIHTVCIQICNTKQGKRLENEPLQSRSNSPGSERRLLLPRVWLTHPNRGPAGLLHSSGKTEDGFRNTQLPDVPLNVQQLPLCHILIRKKPRQHFLLTPLN